MTPFIKGLDITFVLAHAHQYKRTTCK